MKISDLLASKGTAVATVDPGASVADAVEELAAHNVGALVVSANGSRVEGIVSERDVVRALRSASAEALKQSVSSIMSAEVRTCSPEDTVDSLMITMTEHRIRHVPVVVDGQLQGIVSIGDVVKSRIGELEDDRKALYDYINAR
ncbi:MAG TPA: CBS domain-containing protein [Acidimicrobiales bacterium]|jgi:CBS domain-containing protein|nr:CBS domain-containing protein [Acidimicrobiales bacterium]